MGFTIIPAAPTIASVLPTSGYVGDEIAISGTNLSSTTSVKFNGVSAIFTVNSATQITATIPTGCSSGLVEVTTAGGTVRSSNGFTVDTVIGTEFPVITVRNNDDWLIIQDSSGAYKRIRVSDFIAGLSSGSTTPTSDPYFSNTVLLMHFNGTNDSISFTDVKGKIVTTGGTAKISTTQSKFGDASSFFDGSSYLAIANSADFNFETGNFTIEAFFYQTSNTGTQNIIKGYSGSTATGLEIAAGKPRLWIDGIGAFCEAPSALVLNQWNHIAMVRNGNTFTNFINGTSVAQSSQTSAFNLQIGTDINIARSYYNSNYIGYLDELRVTKGIARYTSNFTVSTAQFPDS